MAIDFRKLTHDEIIFRVLLQREEARSSLTYAALEAVIPREIRKRLEPDWRSYIREEGLEFDSAFQKTVRKHLPGVYYVVMATEFLGKMPFHLALGHFLLPGEFKWDATSVNEEEIFELAERLDQEVRRRCMAATGAKPIPSEPKIVRRPREPVRRCAFCKEWIPITEIIQHVDHIHINPRHLGEGLTPAAAPIQRLIPKSIKRGKSYSTKMRPETSSSDFSRFTGGRCIGCGKIPIPGDFYCYHCAPK